MNNQSQLREMILERLKKLPRSSCVIAKESQLNWRTIRSFLLEGNDVSFASHLKLEKYLVKLEQEVDNG